MFLEQKDLAYKQPKYTLQTNQPLRNLINHPADGRAAHAQSWSNGDSRPPGNQPCPAAWGKRRGKAVDWREFNGDNGRGVS